MGLFEKDYSYDTIIKIWEEGIKNLKKEEKKKKKEKGTEETKIGKFKKFFGFGKKEEVKETPQF